MLKLLLDDPDILVQVVDTKNLARALTLTFEIVELGIPMVLCLNMQDEAQNRGYRPDLPGLAKLLGIPVVTTVATTGNGINDLRHAIKRATIAQWKNAYPSQVEALLKATEGILTADAKRWAALIVENRAFVKDNDLWSGKIDTPTLKRLATLIDEPARAAGISMAGSRQRDAKRIAERFMPQPRAATTKAMTVVLETCGRWCIAAWPGYAIAIAVVIGVYEFVGVFGAQTAVKFLEETLFAGVINPWLSKVVNLLLPWPLAKDFLIGEYGLFTMAITYAFALILPIVTTFFIALGLLEDSGYLPRLSVLADRSFRRLGLNGKAVIPMVLGLGCGTMAVLTGRILDTKKEKFVLSFLLALAIPCSAQLGVIMGMAAAMAWWVSVVWVIIVIGTLLTAGTLAAKAVPGVSAPFMMEIPPMRVPMVGNIVRKTLSRLEWYLKEVVPLFIYATAALFVLSKTGLLGVLVDIMSPVVTGVLGLPKEASEAFLIGFFRRDYGAAGFYQLQRAGLLNLRQGLVAMVTITLFMPCIAQWLMMVRERGLYQTAMITAFVTGYSLGVAALVNWTLLGFGFM
ncbi:MAG: ferrous iron transporter B [Elusimicrobiota bacterium]